MIRSIFCLFFLSISGLSLQGQITLTKADMPTSGDSLYVSTPDSLVQIDLETTGPGSNWDVQFLEAALQQRDIFISPSEAPFSLSFFFLGTNLVRLIPTPDSIAGFGLGEGFQYFKSTSAGYEDMGFGGFLNGIPVPLAKDPADEIYRFPLTYGNDTSTSESLVELSIPGLIFLRQEQIRTTVVDGWGTIQTPYGTFDALRVVSTLAGRDSIEFDTLSVAIDRPVNKEYKWLANGEGLPILQVNTSLLDSLGEVQTNISYRDSARSNVPLVGLRRTLDSAPLRLYPNPSNQQVFLEGLPPHFREAEVSIYTLEGKKVLNQPISFLDTRVQLTHLPAGNYLVQLIVGDKQYRGKLLIQR